MSTPRPNAQQRKSHDKDAFGYSGVIYTNNSVISPGSFLSIAFSAAQNYKQQMCIRRIGIKMHCHTWLQENLGRSSELIYWNRLCFLSLNVCHEDIYEMKKMYFKQNMPPLLFQNQI